MQHNGLGDFPPRVTGCFFAPSPGELDLGLKQGEWTKLFLPTNLMFLNSFFFANWQISPVKIFRSPLQQKGCTLGSSWRVYMSFVHRCVSSYFFVVCFGRIFLGSPRIEEGSLKTFFCLCDFLGLSVKTDSLSPWCWAIARPKELVLDLWTFDWFNWRPRFLFSWCVVWAPEVPVRKKLLHCSHSREDNGAKGRRLCLGTSALSFCCIHTWEFF